MRIPRHVGLDNQDRVGLIERGIRGPGLIVAEMQVVSVRDVHVDRIRLHHADPARLRDLDQAGHGTRVDARGRGEDDRVLGAREDAGGLVDPRGIREALAARLASRG